MTNDEIKRVEDAMHEANIRNAALEEAADLAEEVSNFCHTNGQPMSANGAMSVAARIRRRLKGGDASHDDSRESVANAKGPGVTTAHDSEETPGEHSSPHLHPEWRWLDHTDDMTPLRAGDRMWEESECSWRSTKMTGASYRHGLMKPIARYVGPPASDLPELPPEWKWLERDSGIQIQEGDRVLLRDYSNHAWGPWVDANDAQIGTPHIQEDLPVARYVGRAAPEIDAARWYGWRLRHSGEITKGTDRDLGGRRIGPAGMGGLKVQDEYVMTPIDPGEGYRLLGWDEKAPDNTPIHVTQDGVNWKGSKRYIRGSMDAPRELQAFRDRTWLAARVPVEANCPEKPDSCEQKLPEMLPGWRWLEPREVQEKGDRYWGMDGGTWWWDAKPGEMVREIYRVARFVGESEDEAMAAAFDKTDDDGSKSPQHWFRDGWKACKRWMEGQR